MAIPVLLDMNLLDWIACLFLSLILICLRALSQKVALVCWSKVIESSDQYVVSVLLLVSLLFTHRTYGNDGG